MAGEVAKAYVSIIPSFQGGRSAIARELDGPVRQGSQTAGSAAGAGFRDGFLGRVRGMAAAIVPAMGVAAVVTYIKGAIAAASDLEQAIGGVDAVFGSSSAQIHEWAAQADQALGLSKTAYSNLATILGSQLKNMGVSIEDLNGQTQSLITLGADLAATYGGTTADAVSAVSALLRGEQDPIERFGVRIMETDVKARMLAQGLGDLEGEAAKNARTQTVLAMLMEQTSAAQGQFGRESDTAAGKLERQRARFDNLQATIGEKLLPIYVKVLDFISTSVIPILEKVVDWVSENTWVIGALAAVIGGALVGAMVSWIASIAASTAALLANPITWIVVGVVALVAAIVLLVKNWDAVTAALSRGWADLTRIGAGIVAWAGNVKDGAIQKLTEFTTWIAGLPQQIANAVAGLGAAMWNAGVAALNGFWEGLQSGWAAFLGWITDDFAGGIVGAVTGALGIHSPSRVFMEIGQNVGRGMEDGIASSRGSVVGQVQSLAASIASTPLTPPVVPMAGVAQRGSVPASAAGGRVQINAYGVDANEVAMKVGRRVDRTLHGLAAAW
ncbi:hypothetical protein EDD28_2390 [Salana multivorans]|uniref:Phage-related minor tail protein n=1 Tax=Salana multivorans TaxID=120377 RepID=A0A3N2DDG2_9MICO|nr:hypothetical protein [Salana multivorans]ROR97782.1 hypothetical protein EDD28_2390 [Salana multivorans]